MLNGNGIIWKTITENPNYEISSDGQIRSKERRVKNSAKSERIVKSRIKKTFMRSDTCQYLYVQLYRNNHFKTYAVHRLVAGAFIANPDKKPMVNHLDGNKLNNNAWNLEWCTCAENHRHAWDTNLKDRDKQRDSMIGTKYGKTSKYHNVTFDASRNKWKATLKINKKMVLQKRLDSEIEAARCVNDYILANGLNRPLNTIT